MHKQSKSSHIWIASFIIATLAVGCLWALPHYRVWSAGMAGQAILRQAEHEKLILLEEGKAKLEAATYTKKILVEQAQAELEAANIRAQAIEIVGEMAQKYPEYRQQEFIGAFAEALQEGNVNQIIYIPTEAGIPITEAHRKP